MDGREKQAYVNEIKYQIKMLNNLRGWLRNLIVISCSHGCERHRLYSYRSRAEKR